MQEHLGNAVPHKKWLDIDSHLQFAEQIILKYDFPSPDRDALYESINQIRSRYADPNLYLAVVGEFSSGKSTFINALLHQKILKTSVLPTTATAARLQYGPQLDVSVLFKNQVKPLKYLESSVQLWQHIHAFHPQRQGWQCNDILDFIRLVTTEDCIAANIHHLIIYHPARFLEDGIVIIDTPGTNAISQNHMQVTCQLIQQEADSAIIIIPGSLLSQSLKTFISQHLRPFLHRSLFVVTQMDKIPEEEQEDVITYLHHSITNDLGINHPVVMYQAAPQIALHAFDGQTFVQQELVHWKQRFLASEHGIREHLQREQALSIAERLLRLMNQLFTQLKTHLRKRQKSYERHETDVEQRLQAQLHAATESTISRSQYELQYFHTLLAHVGLDLNELERRCKVLQQQQQCFVTMTINQVV